MTVGTSLHTISQFCLERRFMGRGLLLCAVLSACGSKEEATETVPGRQVVSLSGTWRYSQEDVMGSEGLSHDDTQWSEVAVPHTWNALDGQDGGDDYRREASWYRRDFKLQSLNSRRHYLQFDGANSVADVYVNGTHLGQHRGGYSAFRFDATDALVEGNNVLAVRVSNEEQLDIPPLRADYTFFGGLYRDIQQLSVGLVHLDLDDMGSPGVYLQPTVETTDAGTTANLAARVGISNDDTESRIVEASLLVLDADGSEVVRFEQQLTLSSGETQTLELGGELANPHLWNGLSDPYLYTVRVELRAGDALLDVLDQALGLRTFALDPNTGFSLNGEYLDLHGVNRHQDWQGKGWAIGAAEHDEDMRLIREIGATSIRLAHYQQAQEFYDRCDREGLIVWAEIPLVDENTESEDFVNNARQQMTELIRQSYNHPSIVFWGIGNEQRTDDAASNELLAGLAELTRQEDPARLSAYAHCCNSETAELTKHSDAIGYNTYNGWYSGSYTGVGLWADAVHATQPERAVALSEYGAGGSLRQHSDNRQPPVTTSDFHPEEYQTALHEASWQQLATRPFIWGKYVWNMFDFASDSRSEGDALGINDKGLISYDRTQKKDAFFWYKANWSTEPMLHIVSRRFNPRYTPTVDIKIYSNQPSVALTVNGVEQGLEESTGPLLDNTAEHVFLFRQVALQVGDNVVEARAGADSQLLDSIVWERRMQ